jgi:hypothetical protein
MSTGINAGIRERARLDDGLEHVVLSSGRFAVPPLDGLFVLGILGVLNRVTLAPLLDGFIVVAQVDGVAACAGQFATDINAQQSHHRKLRGFLQRGCRNRVG